MKIKLDENLPTSLIPLLEACGHDVDIVVSEGLSGCDDESVWNAAQATGRFFVTQDLDFSDVRRFTPGSHLGILVVRLKEPGRLALLDRIQAVFRSENVQSWAGCFVVVTEHKIRVLRARP